MIKMRKDRIRKFRKKQRLWIFKLGKEKMESATTKEFSSSKEAMLSLERLLRKRDGFRMKMFGRHTTTSNGQLEFVTLII